ncbi:MAG: 50S ribosomal protein L29 [Bacteroidales bacterium]|jgi:large subunit ribosomal protein L29|nr:50S ribosomal protein L29 [Bacteroidales bacterium]
MKMSEVKELSTGELKERIDTEKNMLVKMRLNHAISPLDNPMKLKFIRKDIARMLTELKRREAAEIK